MNLDATGFRTEYSPAGHAIAMPVLPPLPEPLTNRVCKWQKALHDAASGPLVIAKEVMIVADEWDFYQEQAGGISCNDFMRAKLGHGISWFRKRAESVEKLGEAIRRYMDHDAAVWVAGVVTESHMEEVKKVLRRDCRARGGHPLSLGQTILRVNRIIGKQPKCRTCARCQKLEQVLTAHGIDLPE